MWELHIGGSFIRLHESGNERNSHAMSTYPDHEPRVVVDNNLPLLYVMSELVDMADLLADTTEKPQKLLCTSSFSDCSGDKSVSLHHFVLLTAETSSISRIGWLV